MKIFVFSTCILYLKSISGGDIVLPQIVRKWPAGKYDLQVITSKEGHAVWEGLGARATFHLLPETVLDRSDSILLGPFKYFVRTLQSIAMVSRVIAKEKGNFLIYTAPEFVPDTLPALIARVRFKQSRWLSWCYHVIIPPWKRRGNFWFNLFSYLIQRGGLAMMKWKADLVLVLGGTYQDLVDEGFRKEKLQISNAGVDKKLLESAVPIKERYDGISIGTLTYTRGVYDLLEIWKLVVGEKVDARLAIVGGASKGLVEDYKKRIEEMGLTKNVNYFGFVPKNEDVYAILKSSKLYLCPLHENGWSLPVAEAMTVGVPTVAYDLKMFHYAFKKGFVMVPMHAKKEFAGKVLQLLGDDEKRQRLANEALLESKSFDWQNIADDLGGVIDNLHHQPKKLIALMNSYSQGKSGGDAFFIEVAKRLTDYEKVIVTSFLGKGLCESGGLRGKYLITTQESEFRDIIRTYLKRMWKAVFLKIKVGEGDVFLGTSDFLPDTLPISWLKVRNKKVKWVQHIFHLIPSERPIPFLAQRISFLLVRRLADVIVVDNTFLKEELAGLGFDPQKIHINYPGINLSYLRAIDAGDRRGYDGIFMARLHPSKGIFDLAKIWRLVCEKIPQARLGIIGRGSEKVIKQLEGSIAEVGLERAIDLLGHLADDDAFAIIKASKVFVFPSREEGFGIAPLEAQALGLPVVAWDLPVFGEVFPQGMVRVELGSVEEFAGVVLNLLTNTFEYERIAGEAIANASRFEWNRAAERELTLIENGK